MGALLALVFGHLVVADERTTGIGRLLFSRQLTGTRSLVGRATAAAAVLAVALAASLLVSELALLVANGALPTVAETGRLVLFYGLSLVCLTVFALVGIAAVLLTHRRSLALLSAMDVWLLITFAVPQFTSGLRPTTSLNRQHRGCRRAVPRRDRARLARAGPGRSAASGLPGRGHPPALRAPGRRAQVPAALGILSPDCRAADGAASAMSGMLQSVNRSQLASVALGIVIFLAGVLLLQRTLVGAPDSLGSPPGAMPVARLAVAAALTGLGVAVALLGSFLTRGRRDGASRRREGRRQDGRGQRD